ncbi:MAG: hypothetical protein CME70_03000 [Halobacteriovorax sp.]|nr:hypothetical protein [Halobacteriovorax sp.]|tara:strand:- start:36835 stop:39303 length:2469 start_codon:yes stop_codon:yes gene_type:complete
MISPYRYTLPILVFIISLCGFAQSTIPPDVEIQQYASNIYTRAGLAKEKILFDKFLLSYKEFLHLKVKGKAKKNIIGFVDFNKISGSERFVIVDVTFSNPRVIATELVSHGQGSGSYWKAKTFSNTPNSFKSSLGTYITGERYWSNRFGDAMRLDGITSGQNTNVRSRAIVFHSGFYVNKLWATILRMVGKSKGCLTVRKRVVKKLINILQNGSVIFVHHNTKNLLKNYKMGPQHVAIAKGGRGALLPSSLETEIDDISTSTHFQNTPQTQLSGKLPLEKATDMSRIWKYAKILGIGALTAKFVPKLIERKNKNIPTKFKSKNNVVNHKGEAKFTGNSDLENCQALSSEPLDVVARKVQEGGANPHAFFRGSWRDLGALLKTPISIDNGDVPKASRNLLTKINECAAMVSYLDPNNFQRMDPNRKSVTSSKDKKITCRYQGVESADNSKCEELIAKYDNLRKEEAQLRKKQGDDFKKYGDEVKAKVANGNIQSSALIASNSLRDKKTAMAGTRSRFKTHLLNNLAKSLSAFPNYDSLYRKCSSNFNRHNNLSVVDYSKFNAIYSNGFDFSLSSLGEVKDPCADSLKNSNLVMMHNNHTKDEVSRLLSEIGIEKSDLEGKIATLRSQNSPTLNRRGGSIQDSSALKISSLKSVISGKNESTRSKINDLSQRDTTTRLNNSNQKNDSNYLGNNLRSHNETGSSDSLAGKVVKNTSGISTNDPEENLVMSLVENNELDKLKSGVLSGEINWDEVVYEYSQGKISKATMRSLASETGNKIYRLKSFTKNQQKAKKDIHNENVSLFGIISNRYSRKLLEGDISAKDK